MEEIIKEFIGDYIYPNEEFFYNHHHDPMEKGYLFCNDLDIIEEYLLRFPFLVNDQSNFFANSTLFIACEYDLHEVVYMLIDHGAKISLKNIFGWSAYDVAYHHNSYNSINLLHKKAVLLIENAWINYKINQQISKDISCVFKNKLSLK